jgi:colanic acid/amylovoran biosynthesis glycosyltransferase
MKVLHYCNQFSPISQTFIFDVVVHLQNVGVDNVVVTNLLLNQKDRPFKPVIVIPEFKQNFYIKCLLRGLHLIGAYKFDWYNESLIYKNRVLEKIIGEQKPQVLHAHFGTAGFEVLRVVNKLKIPLVVSFHGFDAFKLPKDSVWLNNLQNVFNNASAITVVSNLMKTHLIQLGCPMEKISLIHVGKNFDDYNFTIRHRKPIRHFISIGRLIEKKGHEDSIKAFKLLESKYPDLRLDIIGEGPLQNQLDILVHNLDLSSKVRLLGQVNHKQTMRNLLEADAFILSSRTSGDGDQEGIPTVLMEAQAVGIPCVTTLHSGIPEVIPAENHWMLAEEKDVNGIAATIEKLILCDPEMVEQATVRGRDKVLIEFNLDTEVRKLKDLYQSFKSNGKSII